MPYVFFVVYSFFAKKFLRVSSKTPANGWFPVSCVRAEQHEGVSRVATPATRPVEFLGEDILDAFGPDQPGSSRTATADRLAVARGAVDWGHSSLSLYRTEPARSCRVRAVTNWRNLGLWAFSFRWSKTSSRLMALIPGTSHDTRSGLSVPGRQYVGRDCCTNGPCPEASRGNASPHGHPARRLPRPRGHHMQPRMVRRPAVIS
jgi:hypothetical protein